MIIKLTKNATNKGYDFFYSLCQNTDMLSKQNPLEGVIEAGPLMSV